MDLDWSDDEGLLEVLSDDPALETGQPLGHLSNTVKSSIEFSFPFEPYGIQRQLMSKVYEALEQRKIGIFESPTGTGKSMSLICAALKWLEDHEEQRIAEVNRMLADAHPPPTRESAATKKSEAKVPDWIANYTDKRAEKEKVEKVRREREALMKKEKRLMELREGMGQTAKRQKKEGQEWSQLLQTDELRQSYETDMQLVEDEFLLNQSSLAEEERSSDGEADEQVHVTKIYYCSRTHSQLSQFVGEVMKSPYNESTRLVTLGSRQNMCVNPSVSKLKSLNLINDRCKELVRNGKSKAGKGSSKSTCSFYNSSKMNLLTDVALSKVKDIEDLVDTGRTLKACPYYSARRAIPSAQLVVLPYNTLLHNSTREASGILLKDNIVIIDEAHNLLDTISNIHSVEVSLSQLCTARGQLERYRDKYRTRLLAANLLKVNQLIHVIGQLEKLLQQVSGESSKLHTVNNFLELTDLDNFNFFHLLTFCKQSQIARKLYGFTEKSNMDAAKEKSKKKTTSSGMSALICKLKCAEQETVTSSAEEDNSKDVHQLSSPLYVIESLLEALTNSDTDGRVIVNSLSTSPAGSKASIKYLLLNPAIYFSKIVQECRSVVVAGGTMQPVEEFKDQLLHVEGFNSERVLEFGCGHIISDKHILPIALSKGLGGHTLEFTHQLRNTSTTLDALSSVLQQACEHVPGGIVCFLPSYQYELTVYNHLVKSGMLDKLSARKKVFREPKKSSMVETVLDLYTKSIKTSGGALLFSVVGGKMSEGINFSDDLGRCVLMVGLPYPNKNSVELQEKLKYLNKTASRTQSDGGLTPGQLHYENLCMKAVNQSIGRAIRHRGDYACILLVDHRYQRQHIISKLPGWLRDQVRKVTDLRGAITLIDEFFVTPKNN